jgi:hypothetical protein
MNELTITEFARMGGKARQKALNKAQRRELALKGVAGRAKKKRLAKVKI